MIQHRPLLGWSVAFIVGIAAWSCGLHAMPVLCVCGLAGLGLLARAIRRWEWTFVGILLTGFAIGALRMGVFQIVAPADVSHWVGGVAPVHVIGVIVTDPEEHLGRTTLRLHAQQVRTARQQGAVTGDVYVALTQNAMAGQSLDYGDLVGLDGHLETPQDATNPGAFSWRDYLARRDVFCQLRVKRPDAVQHLGGGHINFYMALAWAVRRRVLSAVDSALPPTEAAVLSGILLGKRTDLPPDLTADFIHTGTVHILATAGLHVGIVAWWLLFLCERLTLPRKASAVAIIGTLWLYALMAGGRPSVTRAVVMATVYFAAILFERDPDLPTTLAVAALAILFVQPTALLESGFQLSFMTVLTLVLLMPIWEQFWKPKLEARIKNLKLRKAVYWTLEMAGLSLLAQVGSAPIVALSYNEFSLVGFFANLAVVPLLFLLIPIGFFGALIWNIWPLVGTGLLALAGEGLRVVVWAVRGFGELGWAYRALPTPSVFGILLYYLGVVGLAWMVGRARPVNDLIKPDDTLAVAEPANTA